MQALAIQPFRFMFPHMVRPSFPTGPAVKSGPALLDLSAHPVHTAQQDPDTQDASETFRVLCPLQGVFPWIFRACGLCSEPSPLSYTVNAVAAQHASNAQPCSASPSDMQYQA